MTPVTAIAEDIGTSLVKVVVVVCIFEG